MPSPSNHQAADIWGKTLVYTLLGFVFYAMPWPAFAALPLPSNDRAALRIQGSNTIGAKLGPALVTGLLRKEGFKEITARPGAAENEQSINALSPTGSRVRIELAAHGSSTGFAALEQGSADLAAASRSIKDSEVTQMASRGDMKSAAGEHVIALDGLAIIVHPDNPLGELSTAQLAAIFSGEAKTWEAVGGRGGAIHLYARDDNSGTYDTFKELVLASHGRKLAGSAGRYESSDQLSDLVSQDPAGIGFIGLPYVRKAKAVAIADGSAQAMMPSEAGIATEDYPLARRLYFYAPPDSDNAWVKALTEFAQSGEGQKIVAENGFVGQRVQALRIQPDTRMPADYRVLATKGQRLTVNFRFAEGSATLDNKAQRDIQRVLDYVQTQPGKQVALVGFSDDKADPERAQLLSRLRAMAVRRELFRGGVLPREITGFGNLLPVAANDDLGGRIRNRRVEVWIY